VEAPHVTRTADVVVVGGGAAGLAAAWAAARKGLSVILVERHRLGGDCTWTGCVPSKALLEQARKVKVARDLGLDPDIPWDRVIGAVHARRELVSEDESPARLAADGIDVLHGQASFTAPGRLDVEGTAVTARRAIVLATGSRAALPPVPGLADAAPLTNETVFELDRRPGRLVVVGGGPIGLELGQAFQRLGTEVTIVEAAPRLATREEPEASATIQRVLEDEGVQVRVGAQVAEVARGADGVVRVALGDGAAVEADELLVAAGRRPITEGLACDRGGVEVDGRGAIVVDDKLRTTADGVYAVGDVIGGLQLTHVGYDQGSLAVANATGLLKLAFDDRVIPWVTFTDPEIGRVGLTEAEAHAEHGDAARVAYLPLADTDRAKATGEREGFVKLVAGPHAVTRGLAGGTLVGATVVAPTGGDVVHEVALAIKQKVITGRLAQMVHAYPSWSLAVREAAAQFFFEHKGRTARPARPEPPVDGP
jgi:pyruvate/2-oxoglutarate dehydrogenase complex dihydrolipoamide dehydrogenase (E3) component